MNDLQTEKAFKILDDIEELYSTRQGTQADITSRINEKYDTKLRVDDIAGITKQLGYYHTVKRDDLKRVVIFVDKDFKERL